MSYFIDRPKGQIGSTYKNIIQEIKKTDAFSNETEDSLLTKILEGTLEEEKSIEACRKLVGMKSKVVKPWHLEKMVRKLDELKSDISKDCKEQFKEYVKELCGIEVFHDSVSMHIPKPTKEKKVTALHKDAERVLEYLRKRDELNKILLKEDDSVKKLEESKGFNSERSRKRREISSKMVELLHGLQEVKTGISQIEKALKSFNQSSKVAYAKVISGNFENIKARLFGLVDKTKLFENELKQFIKEGKKSLKGIPDYIDEDCEVCNEKEKKWDDRQTTRHLCDPMTAEDARNFHTRLVKSGGMRGLVDQIKSLLSCETTDTQIALPTLFCSMTDPKRADDLYNLISENNFLKEFRNEIFKKSKLHKSSRTVKKECMVCGVTLNRCSF
ncbi:unnamed protein product [Nezara viridula]|uniref:Uncharacterized protein n=1 Tax=Nezara viridula TaxID=85310 RepID=A0A9P0MVR1_NEZVI|nr:unnamed protein product [Nezara viridula]